MNMSEPEISLSPRFKADMTQMLRVENEDTPESFDEDQVDETEILHDLADDLEEEQRKHKDFLDQSVQMPPA